MLHFHSMSKHSASLETLSQYWLLSISGTREITYWLCSVLQPSSIRGLATPWTYFLHLSLSFWLTLGVGGTAQWQNVSLWPVNVPCPALDLSWLVTTYVGEPSTTGQPTRPTQPFILWRSKFVKYVHRYSISILATGWHITHKRGVVMVTWLF